LQCLGQGLSLGAGSALAAKRHRSGLRTFAIASDPVNESTAKRLSEYH
jgi:transketolase N-terminal domain/subunit